VRRCGAVPGGGGAGVAAGPVCAAGACVYGAHRPCRRAVGPVPASPWWGCSRCCRVSRTRAECPCRTRSPVLWCAGPVSWSCGGWWLAVGGHWRWDGCRRPRSHRLYRTRRHYRRRPLPLPRRRFPASLCRPSAEPGRPGRGSGRCGGSPTEVCVQGDGRRVGGLEAVCSTGVERAEFGLPCRRSAHL
jgi:hypothetical protein